LDFDLLVAALTRDDFDFIGCIGSDTKQARFTQRLRHQGFDDERIAKIAMPIGNLDIGGKLPIEVAVSIAAQLITQHHKQQSRSTRQGLQGKQLRANQHSFGVSLSQNETVVK
ncbi:MAG: XdhC family protein, partial [Oleibacter sp.]|nr:XdhC family protein [Thalassolituus sp.]